MTNIIRHPNSHGAAARMEIRFHLAGLGVPRDVAHQAELKAQEIMDQGLSPSVAFDYAMRPFRGQQVAAPGSFLSPSTFGQAGSIRQFKQRALGHCARRADSDNPPPNDAA